MIPEGPKIEAEGRERGWGSWAGAASLLYTS